MLIWEKNVIVKVNIMLIPLLFLMFLFLSVLHIGFTRQMQINPFPRLKWFNSKEVIWVQGFKSLLTMLNTPEYLITLWEVLLIISHFYIAWNRSEILTQLFRQVLLILTESSEAPGFFFIIRHLADCPCAAGELLSPSSKRNTDNKSAQTGPLPASLSQKPTKPALLMSRDRI